MSGNGEGAFGVCQDASIPFALTSGFVMIRGFDALRDGPVFFNAPSGRQRQLRRRGAALAVILGVAFTGALIGQLSSVQEAGRPTPPGPFSYFPN